MTFTPAHGPAAVEEALAEADAEEAEPEAAGLDWVAAGLEQPARASRRTAARGPAAAVRILVKVTCQG
jgi:hypothetical protein